MDAGREQLIRQVRQRIEALRRSGVDRIPMAAFRAQEVVPGDEPPEAGAEPDTPPASAKTASPGSGFTLEPTAARAATRGEPTPMRREESATALFAEDGFESPALSLEERVKAIDALRAQVAVCQRCPVLAAERTQTVFGEGSLTPRLMFIGEAPGADEDRLGRPFVGRAGTLLTDIITKGMGLAREEVYIANVLKSRPPSNRLPLPDEMAHCLPYLEQQIEILRPEFICLLGATAAAGVLKQTGTALARLRGRWHSFRGIPVIVTYHPAYLLRNPDAKRYTWEDLQVLMERMGIKPPARSQS